jgi:ADP-ribosylglycohydrolase
MDARTQDLAHDRAAGVLLGAACGDALGAGYEFAPPMRADAPVDLIGGGLGPFAPGEWTDDTALSVAVAEAAAQGMDLRSADGLDVVADGFRRWFAEGPKDVGNQTRAVLSAVPTGDARAMAERARRVAASSNGRSAGNGALMRTAAVALAHLDDAQAAFDAAVAVGELTHADTISGEACGMWTLAIRHAVLHGDFGGLRDALAYLDAGRRAYWSDRLDEAESRDPSTFRRNGWVVEALQGAWSAITRTPMPDDDPAAGTFAAQHLQLALETTVRGGGDTDTVAAIAGALLGARWGVTAIPARWRRKVFGWPGYCAPDLVELAVKAARLSTGRPPDTRNGWRSASVVDYSGWWGTDSLAVHPHDDRVLLGGIEALRRQPDGVEAVVSLCRLGRDEWPAPGVRPEDHVTIWLVDSVGANPHLDFVLRDAASAVAALRREGRTVLLHCVAAHSRTPTVAALFAYLAFGVPVETALRDVLSVLPGASPNPSFRSALAAISGASVVGAS